MDNATLVTIINENPAALAAKQAGNDAECARILNIRNQRGWVPLVEVEQYCLLNGISPMLYVVSQDVQSPLFGVAWTAYHYFTSSKYQNIDLDLPAVTAMLDALETGTIITTQQKNTIMAMADNRWSIIQKTFGISASVSADTITGVTL